MTRASSIAWGVPVVAWLAAAGFLLHRAVDAGSVISSRSESGGQVEVELLDAQGRGWARTGNLSIGRISPSLAELPDGRVLAVGGTDRLADGEAGQAPPCCEAWSPSTGRWAPHPGPPGVRRAARAVAVGTRVVMADAQRAWILSGTTWAPTGEYDAAPCAARPVLDQDGGTSAQSPVCLGDDCLPTLVALDETHVLALCGEDVEELDVSTGAWRSRAPMSEPREQPLAVPLPEGRVLVLAGERTPVEHTSEIYDRATDTWTWLPPATRNDPHGMVVVHGTRVVGVFGFELGVLDLKSRQWTMSPVPDPPLLGPAVALGPGGRVLVAGGSTSPGRGTELQAWWVDPATRAWTDAPHLEAAHRMAGVLTLVDGRVMVAGGEAWMDVPQWEGVAERLVRWFLALAALVAGAVFFRKRGVPVRTMVVAAVVVAILVAAGVLLLVSAMPRLG